ncbi:MAG: quercetin dioxygenase-like cupin family protein [Marivirga sp.]|jgi:quercetin dioxygenase-like cupin family protein
MNLANTHSIEKPISATLLFKGEGGTTALQILKHQVLKEHTSKVPALLICVVGEVVFENEKGIKESLQSGDYIAIDPLVKHMVTANADSQLILLK